MEITGTEGTLVIPDPNHFSGEVKITRAPARESIMADAEWEVVPTAGALAGRGIGVLDVARSIRTGKQPLASGKLAYHVLDTLIAIEEAAATDRVVDITSTIDPIPLVPEGWDPFAATL